MITEKELNSWNQLQAEIENLVENLGEKTGDLLFRGQADSTWGLDTTVERKLKTPISLNRYYRFAYTAKPRLETFVEVSWDIPTPPEYDSWLNEKDTLSFAPLPGYDYLASRAMGSGHAKKLTLRLKCHNNAFKMVLIDQFSSKTALLRESTKNGSCQKTLYTRLCLAYPS
jgi:hypothetical protein